MCDSYDLFKIDTKSKKEEQIKLNIGYLRCYKVINNELAITKNETDIVLVDLRTFKTTILAK